jgi:hypothetical protein
MDTGITFIETSVFTRQITALLADEDYWRMQTILIVNPAAGDLIQGGGGIRKLRWKAPGRGKRGGVRVIYYWAVSQDQILLLFMYAKNELDNLTAAQLKVLRKIIEEEYP